MQRNNRRRSFRIIDEIIESNFNLNDFLKNDFNDKVIQKCSLKLYDNRNFASAGDMEKMLTIINRFYPSCVELSLYNLNPLSYKELISLKRSNDLNINIFEITLSDYNFEIDPKDFNVKIDPVNFSKLSPYNVDNVSIRQYYQSYFDERVLNNKEFLDGINYIAEQINMYATDDIEKILLLDKMLRENVSFDWYYTNDPELYQNLRDEAQKERFLSYISHSAQSVILKRNTVCSGIATFATIVLKHPKLNIDIKTLEGKAYGGAHAFNEITLDGKKYTCDFTHNITRGFSDPIKHTLVKQPSITHTINNGNFDEYSTMDRDYLMKKYQKIKDIHIKMPELKECSFNIKYSDSHDDEKKIIL